MSFSLSLLKSAFSIPYWIVYHAWTLFLFTKSDMKTTLIPIAVLAACSTPLASLDRLFPMVFWLWLQLLVFNLANQTLDPVEDKINKKSRPLPAGRISLRNAKVLRWSMQVLIIVWSASYSKEVLYATLAGSFLTWLYNEAGWAAGHWAGRNFCIGLGQGAWEVGCCLIAGKSLHTLDSIAINSILCSAAIFGTTIQAQDFKDTAGDRLIGRKTLPLVHPHTARPTLIFLIAIWSVGLSYLWSLTMDLCVALLAVCSVVGWRYFTKTSVKAEQRNFYLYCVWLSFTQVMPAYYRFIASPRMSVIAA